MSVTAIDLQSYASLIEEDFDKRIIRAREAGSDRVVILGHYYQRDEIFNMYCSAMRAFFATHVEYPKHACR